MFIEELVATPLWPDTINVQWKLCNPYLDGIYRFRVTIEASGDVLYDSGNIYDDFQHLAQCIPILNNEVRQQIDVRLKVVPPEINPRRGWVEVERVESLYHGLNKKELLIAKTINRKEELYFRKKVGLLCNIYKARQYGETCKTCVDELTGTVTNSQCPECFGTRFEGGFHRPVQEWVHIEENPVVKQITDVSTSEEKTARLRCTSKVLINKRDLIKDISNNTIWQCTAEPTMVKYRSFVIGQQFVGAALSPKDIRYKVK